MKERSLMVYTRAAGEENNEAIVKGFERIRHNFIAEYSLTKALLVPQLKKEFSTDAKSNTKLNNLCKDTLTDLT